jgi:hypothetical protein
VQCACLGTALSSSSSTCCWPRLLRLCLGNQHLCKVLCCRAGLIGARLRSQRLRELLHRLPQHRVVCMGCRVRQRLLQGRERLLEAWLSPTTSSSSRSSGALLPESSLQRLHCHCHRDDVIMLLPHCCLCLVHHLIHQLLKGITVLLLLLLLLSCRRCCFREVPLVSLLPLLIAAAALAVAVAGSIAAAAAVAAAAVRHPLSLPAVCIHALLISLPFLTPKTTTLTTTSRTTSSACCSCSPCCPPRPLQQLLLPKRLLLQHIDIKVVIFVKSSDIIRTPRAQRDGSSSSGSGAPGRGVELGPRHAEARQVGQG